MTGLSTHFVDFPAIDSWNSKDTIRATISITPTCAILDHVRQARLGDTLLLEPFYSTTGTNNCTEKILRVSFLLDSTLIHGTKSIRYPIGKAEAGHPDSLRTVSVELR